jgi:hypothetical protein
MAGTVRKHWAGVRRTRNSRRQVSPSQTLNVIKEDEPDNRILECAAEILSGDKDLHRLGQQGNVRVIKVADMLDIIRGEVGARAGHEPQLIAVERLELPEVGRSLKFRESLPPHWTGPRRPAAITML